MFLIGCVRSHKRGATFVPIASGSFCALSGGASLNGDLLLLPLLAEQRLQQYYDSAPGVAPSGRVAATDSSVDPEDADDPPLGRDDPDPADPDDAFINHGDDESARADGAAELKLTNRFRSIASFEKDVSDRQSFERRQAVETSVVKIYQEKDTVRVCVCVCVCVCVLITHSSLAHVTGRRAA